MNFYNNKDKDEVKKIAILLKKNGIKPWFDEWDIQPGKSWDDEIEKQIKHIKSAAVFIGPDGIGPWQNIELKAIMEQFIREGLPVIPVILPGCEGKPKVPPLYRPFHYVDFRKNEPNPLEQLIWGITGKRLKLNNET